MITMEHIYIVVGVFFAVERGCGKAGAADKRFNP